MVLHRAALCLGCTRVGVRPSELEVQLEPWFFFLFSFSVLLKVS